MVVVSKNGILVTPNEKYGSRILDWFQQKLKMVKAKNWHTGSSKRNNRDSKKGLVGSSKKKEDDGSKIWSCFWQK